MTKYHTIANETLYAGDAYVYLPVATGEQLPRIRKYKEGDTRPAGIVGSDCILRDEYVQVESTDDDLEIATGARQKAR